MTADIRASALRTIATERDGLDTLHAALADGLGQPFTDAVAMIRAATGRVVVSGMGKSGHVGREARGHPGLDRHARPFRPPGRGEPWRPRHGAARGCR